MKNLEDHNMPATQLLAHEQGQKRSVISSLHLPKKRIFCLTKLYFKLSFVVDYSSLEKWFQFDLNHTV